VRERNAVKMLGRRNGNIRKTGLLKTEPGNRSAGSAKIPNRYEK
jgi:hypothetical protein